MERLIEAAAAHAKANGAAVVEAYAVEADSPSYRFCGFVPVFAAHGFEETGKAGTRRRVMRRAPNLTRPGERRVPASDRRWSRKVSARRRLGAGARRKSRARPALRNLLRR